MWSSRHASIGAALYFISYFDHQSNWVTAYRLKLSLVVMLCCLDSEIMAEYQTSLFIKAVRNDRGGEHLNALMEEHYFTRGVDMQLMTT